MNKEEYLKHFSDSEEKAGKKHKKALTAALDTRKFEIELYWKRATYFWAFIAVTFAAYGLVQRLDTDDKTFMSFFLSCLGFILSFGWVLANRGSKQWQENWALPRPSTDVAARSLPATIARADSTPGNW